MKLAREPDLVDARLLLDSGHSSQSGSWWLDLETGDLEWSSEIYEIFGLDPSQPPSRLAIHEARHPEDRELVTKAVEQSETGGGSFSVIYRIIRSSGEVRLLEARGWVESAPDGLGRHALGTVNDITDAALLARERRLSDEHRELIMHASRDGICGLDVLGQITFFNPAFQELVGRPAAAIADELLHDLVHRDPAGRELHALVDCPYFGEDPGRVIDIDADFNTGHGTVLEVSYVRVGVEEGDSTAAVLSLRDATEQREAARRLHSSLEQIRSLTAQRGKLLDQLAGAQERERLRIAADIHDDSVQTLRAVELVLERRRDQIDDPRCAQLLDEARVDVHQAATRLRGLMSELLPPLPTMSLRDAVLAYGESLLSDTSFGFDVRGDPRELRADTYLLAYRLIQEAVRNARNHSRGTRIEVELGCSLDRLEIVVSDDGVGLDADRVTDSAQGGLRIIRQRLEFAGGKATSGPGLGSRGLAVRMQIPLGDPWPL